MKMRERSMMDVDMPDSPATARQPDDLNGAVRVELGRRDR